MPYQEKVMAPMKRLMSMSDDDADLDVSLLLRSLQEDTDDLFYIRINNVTLEKEILYPIFEALKTTKKIRHLSLAAVKMNDEKGLVLNSAMQENSTLETLNVESNDLTNTVIEPLCEILETHPTIREFKCSHQKNGLGSRGEEAMARALDKNERLLKISYPFKVPSARSLADRSQLRNQEILRQRRTKGEDFYNYRDEVKKRDKQPQPWIRVQTETKNERMKSQIIERRQSMKKIPEMGKLRAEAKQRAAENAKPKVSNELAEKLASAKKRHSRISIR